MTVQESSSSNKADAQPVNLYTAKNVLIFTMKVNVLKQSKKNK